VFTNPLKPQVELIELSAHTALFRLKQQSAENEVLIEMSQGDNEFRQVYHEITSYHGENLLKVKVPAMKTKTAFRLRNQNTVSHFYSTYTAEINSASGVEPLTGLNLK